MVSEGTKCLVDRKALSRPRQQKRFPQSCQRPDSQDSFSSGAAHRAVILCRAHPGRKGSRPVNYRHYAETHSREYRTEWQRKWRKANPEKILSCEPDTVFCAWERNRIVFRRRGE